MKKLLFFSLWSLTLMASEEAIKKRLDQWPLDFNNKNLDAVCNLFAPDLVATYPESNDRGYEDICKQFSQLFQENKTYRYAAPEIEQIIVKDDLAIVRLIWTLTVHDKGNTEVITERGLDVFKRQPDGTWKIKISYAFSM